MTSALYAGEVLHQRFRPRRHSLRYRLCWMLFDVDRPESHGLRLFSHNRPNLVSFHDRDHLDGSGKPLRAQIETHLRAAGIEPDGGPIRVLCMPRVLGYVFNPISTWFCHRQDGSLVAILYEVNNTFGQRHCYLIPVIGSHGPVIRQRCEKQFYVSPFMDMRMTYDFRVVPPDDEVSVVVDGADAEGRIITASFSGRQRKLTDANLLRVVLQTGMLTIKVLAAIHWEAARLWAKGLRLQPRPAPPDRPVTIVLLDKT